MHNVFIVAIVFGGAILILAIIGSTILMGLKILKGGISRKGQKLQTDEARIIQEIYQGLSRMEERVDALETIIMERERKDDKR
ncbi:MAG: phage-shock protein [Deltaproteobacteria bacterium]|nr:phage-shock protein [Deltaproteobacteria bacterium]